jgi:8-oxo-dGTP diphosphatase
MKTEYVLGFALSTDMKRVILLRKMKPAWQKWKLNGVGGKIETGESGPDAMAREFMEETGLHTNAKEWVFFAQMTGADWTCYCFTMTISTDERNTILSHPIDLNNEVLGEYDADSLPFSVIPNLRWLIPMAINRLLAAESCITEVVYGDASV